MNKSNILSGENFMTLMESLIGTTLITTDNTWGLLGIMCITVALSIWLEQTYEWASKVSGAIIALIIAMFAANIGIIPTNSVLYDDIVWGVVVPIGIPLLLLQCNLNKIGKLTGKMLVVFLMGAVGTATGALLAFHALKGAYAAGGGNINDLAGVASIMTGSYIGGGVNFAAMASANGLKGTDTAAAATVADNLLMAAYFFVLIFIAGMKWFRNKFAHPHIDAVESGTDTSKTQAAAFWNRKEISLKDIAINFAYAAIVVTISKVTADFFTGAIPKGNMIFNMLNTFLGSQYIWITTISIVISAVFEKKIEELSGYTELGTYLIYLFFFAIGVPASIKMILTNAPLLFVFTLTIVVVNMIFCLVGGKLLKFDLEDIVLASNANIGGPTTAAAMAISKGWTKLVGPIMLIGTLGYVIGTYMGVIVGSLLGA